MEQQHLVIGDKAYKVESYELSVPTGLPGNYLLVARCHDHNGVQHVVVLTEAGVEAGRFNSERKVFEFHDRGGKPAAIQVGSGDAIVVPDSLCSPYATAADTVFVVVQEGGSSAELYVHQFDKAEDAAVQ
jgi:hypothetical protein